MKSFQDHYPEQLSHCYGCGWANERGHHLASYWDGEETVATFQPESWHTAIPGYVYGGLIASIMDCHGTGTASAAAYRADGRQMGTEPALRFVTGSLQVKYLRPTPMGVLLEVRGRIREVGTKKVIVDVTVSAGDKVCAKGVVVAVRMPEHMVSAD